MEEEVKVTVVRSGSIVVRERTTPMTLSDWTRGHR